MAGKLTGSSSSSKECLWSVHISKQTYSKSDQLNPRDHCNSSSSTQLQLRPAMLHQTAAVQPSLGPFLCRSSTAAAGLCSHNVPALLAVLLHLQGSSSRGESTAAATEATAALLPHHPLQDQ